MKNFVICIINMEKSICKEDTLKAGIRTVRRALVKNGYPSSLTDTVMGTEKVSTGWWSWKVSLYLFSTRRKHGSKDCMKKPDEIRL